MMALWPRNKFSAGLHPGVQEQPVQSLEALFTRRIFNCMALHHLIRLQRNDA